MDIPTVDFLKNHENPPIKTKVIITPTRWVQDIETPPRDRGAWGKNVGNEKFSVPKGVRYISPSIIEPSPMVTMITEIIGSPIRRLKKILSTLMARKKVIIILAMNEKKMGTPTVTVRK
jgi:hypothetical protein